MKLDEILSMSGIVIRNIPEKTINRWRIQKKDEKTHQNNRHFLSNGEEVFYSYERNKDGVLIAIEEKINKLSGFAITFKHDQFDTVNFYKKTSGFGKTIEEAYLDFMAKNK